MGMVRFRLHTRWTSSPSEAEGSGEGRDWHPMAEMGPPPNKLGRVGWEEGKMQS
jgi:hypothetical protein